jgi:hypothetical protein
MNTTMPVPPKPKHVNDTLGRAVVEPPTREAIERVQTWHHRNRQRLEMRRIISLLEDPRTYAR